MTKHNDNCSQMKREKAVKRKEALEHAKREEEEARLAEVVIILNITMAYTQNTYGTNTYRYLFRR